MVDRIDSGRSIYEQDNFAYIRDGELIRNPLRSLVESLDDLPYPDKEVYPYRHTILKVKYAPFFFTRGYPRRLHVLQQQGYRRHLWSEAELSPRPSSGIVCG